MNVTIEGNGNAAKAAFNFKEGTAGNISNVVATNVGFGVDLRNQLDQFNDGTLKITKANITALTALTKNGITGSSVNIDALVTIDATATGADVTPFNTGTWIKN